MKRDQSPPTELRSETVYRMVGVVGAGLVRLWGATLLVDRCGEDNLREIETLRGRVIYTFWHRAILPLAYLYGRTGAVVLISRHRDGEFISQIVTRLGLGTVRGSSTRGGLRALMEMAKTGRAGHPLAVTPDGPRGPRGELQAGVLHIAQRSGLPIVPLAVEAVRRTLLDSWMPSSSCTRVALGRRTGKLLWIPEEADPSSSNRSGRRASKPPSIHAGIRLRGGAPSVPEADERAHVACVSSSSRVGPSRCIARTY